MHVVMMVMPMSAANRLGKVLDVRKCIVLRSRAEVVGKLVQLIGLGGIAVRARGGCSVLQIGRDLGCDLLIFGWVGLLQLLQRAHNLGERRQGGGTVLG